MVTLCFDVDTILHSPTHCTMRNNERYKIGIILEMSIEIIKETKPMVQLSFVVFHLFISIYSYDGVKQHFIEQSREMIDQQVDLSDRFKFNSIGTGAFGTIRTVFV
ncbi:hypothetical protein BLOT_003325 [Blomia tropicalis]|nr:hypothetical protein BLOT_003325 [Blomia tropicalis]